MKETNRYSAQLTQLPGSGALCAALAISFSFWTHDGRANCASVPSGLVSWWRAENNALDSVSLSNGTLSGGASFATGEVGQGFSFDGTGEVVVPSIASLNLTTFTFEASMNPSVLDGNMEIILNKENNPALNEADVSYEMAIRGMADPGTGSIPLGHLAFFVGGISGLPGGYGSWVDGGDTVPTNQWSHCALTFDGTTIRAYVNGTLTRTIDGLSGTVIATTGPFKIGSRSELQVSAAPASRFNGLIDEVAVFNRAVTSNEVAASYAAGTAGICPPPQTNCCPAPSGLVAWWPMQSNAVDVVGGHNGTLAGAYSFAAGEVGLGLNASATTAGASVADSPDLHLSLVDHFALLQPLLLSRPPRGELVW